METTATTFPIMLMADPWKQLPAQMNSIPWEAIAPHERYALLNHDQSLKKLASRGGLSPCEAVAILEDRKYRDRWPNLIHSSEQMVAHNTEAINRLRELCPPNELSTHHTNTPHSIHAVAPDSDKAHPKH